VSVQSSKSSIKRGQTATYTVQVSTKGGSASNVSVALTAQPSTEKPEFITSGCTNGDGKASCTVAKVPATLQAQIAVASNASSVSSLKLTATASVATTAKTWTPPAATATTSVTGAASSAKASPSATHLPTLALGPIPNLNAEASLLIGAGNAAGLFPAITPSATPSTGQVVLPQAGRQNAEPVSGASTVSYGAPVFTAQVVGLIALGLAIILTVTRLSVRKRSGSRGAGS
jgi:hypothetical protein